MKLDISKLAELSKKYGFMNVNLGNAITRTIAEIAWHERLKFTAEYLGLEPIEGELPDELRARIKTALAGEMEMIKEEHESH